jgi:hypothetical protein
MFSYLGGICEGRKSNPIRIGGAIDHVHVLCRLGRTIGIADLVRSSNGVLPFGLNGIAEHTISTGRIDTARLH